MIQYPDPCPGPAQFTGTDIALVTYKEWLTGVVMKVSAPSLGTDRSCFSCVCVALWTLLGIYVVTFHMFRSWTSEYITCFITILWNIKCIATAILCSNDDTRSCLSNVYVSMHISIILYCFIIA